MQGVHLNQPVFAAPASGSKASTIFGTLATIVVLVVLVMGALYVYKRYIVKDDVPIGMHFENPRSAMEAARVKMCMFNEILVNRYNNNNTNGKQNEMPASTMVEEQEATDRAMSIQNDDTLKLLS